VWLVDPIAKTLEVYTLGAAGKWREIVTHQGDALVRAPPFEAIALELGALWAPPRVT
jgi:Uma2 family endonuclease